jgi:ATP-dependent exoDNAse (exonuclease V) beta subunit
MDVLNTQYHFLMFQKHILNHWTVYSFMHATFTDATSQDLQHVVKQVLQLDQFEPTQVKAFEYELKLLYTAITRAEYGLYIVKINRKAVKPLKLYLKSFYLIKEQSAGKLEPIAKQVNNIHILPCLDCLL